MAKIKRLLLEWEASDKCLSVFKDNVFIHYSHATLFNDDL